MSSNCRCSLDKMVHSEREVSSAYLQVTSALKNERGFYEKAGSHHGALGVLGVLMGCRAGQQGGVAPKEDRNKDDHAIMLPVQFVKSA